MAEINCTIIFVGKPLNVDINELVSLIVIVDSLLDQLEKNEETIDYGLEVRGIMIDACIALLECYLSYDLLFASMRLNEINMLLDSIDVALSNDWQIDNELTNRAFNAISETIYYSFVIISAIESEDIIDEPFDSSFCNRILKADSRAYNGSYLNTG